MEVGWLALAIVVGIGIILAFTLQVIRMGIAHEEKRMALKAGISDASRLEQIIAANETEIAKLRQRVEVLERLATDDERRLTREISGLASDRTTA
jgi:cell division protein FtsB